MASFQVTVKGLDELRTKIKMIGDGMGDILEEAVFQGATVVVKEAQRNSARGGNDYPHRRTGNLFRSIPEVSPAIVSKTQYRVEVAVGSAAEYARRLELGFSGTDSRGRTYHQSPRPFLRPALDDNQDKVEAEIQKRLMLLIGRHAK